jgi:ferredoxin
MKVRVDRELCVGISNCVSEAPSVFQLDKENRAIVLDTSSVAEEKIMIAAQSCPMNAIIIEDDQGTQIYP